MGDCALCSHMTEGVLVKLDGKYYNKYLFISTHSLSLSHPNDSNFNSIAYVKQVCKLFNNN